MVEQTNKNNSRFSLKKEKTNYKKVKITDSKIAAEYAKSFYFDDIDIYESFFIILLDRANNTIGYAKISQGGIVGTYVDVKIIAKYAIDSLASGVILVHNHPSHKLLPSNDDIRITRKLIDGLALLDVSVLDHIIITGSSESNYYRSMQDHGDVRFNI